MLVVSGTSVETVVGGPPEVSVTGQMVVYSGIVSVVTEPLPGQSVTDGAHDVTVYITVVITVLFVYEVVSGGVEVVVEGVMVGTVVVCEAELEIKPLDVEVALGPEVELSQSVSSMVELVLLNVILTVEEVVREALDVVIVELDHEMVREMLPVDVFKVWLLLVVIEDKVAEDEVMEDEVMEDEVMNDEVVEDEMIEDEVAEGEVEVEVEDVLELVVTEELGGTVLEVVVGCAQVSPAQPHLRASAMES